jgi:hypothetical protein
VRTTLPLGNSQKKKEISNPAIRKFSKKKKKEVQTLPSEELFFILVKGNRQMGFQANPTKDRIYRIARSGSQNN